MQFTTFFTLAIAMVAGAHAECIADWAPCQPDGSMGNCCSGNCFKADPTWANGNCQPV